jgi:hypothetical protein
MSQGRKGRLGKHPDGGKKMIENLKKLGFWKKLKRARPRTTDSGHRVGVGPDDDE